MNFSVNCKNIEETEKLEQTLAEKVKENGDFICMFGEVGAGKTAFAKFVCKYLDVKEKVTSPSFVILNEYKTGVIPVYHFDLYRLEKEGINTIINELDEYSEGKILTLVEWAEFSQNNLPFDRIELNINYINDSSRDFIFYSYGQKSDKIIEELSKC